MENLDKISNKIDALLHYLYEVELPEEQKAFVKEKLIGRHKGRYNGFVDNNKLVTSEFCQRFSELRSLGLTQKDSAILLGITGLRLERLLDGEGLSDKQHEMLLIAEQVGDSNLKHRALMSVDRAIEKGSWKAALSLLEKKFPEEWGRKIEIQSVSDVRMSTEDYERASDTAHQDLRKIRASRKLVTQDNLYVGEEI